MKRELKKRIAISGFFGLITLLLPFLLKLDVSIGFSSILGIILFFMILYATSPGRLRRVAKEDRINREEYEIRRVAQLKEEGRLRAQREAERTNEVLDKLRFRKMPRDISTPFGKGLLFDYSFGRRRKR